MNNKRTILLIGALVLLAALVYAVYDYKKYNDNIISYREPNLSTADKALFEGRISEIQTELADKSITVEEQYKKQMELGATYVALGEYLKAQDSYLAAAKLLPDNISPLIELVDLAISMNDDRAARGYLKKLIKIDPSNATLYETKIKEIENK